MCVSDYKFLYNVCYLYLFVTDHKFIHDECQPAENLPYDRILCMCHSMKKYWVVQKIPSLISYKLIFPNHFFLTAFFGIFSPSSFILAHVWTNFCHLVLIFVPSSQFPLAWGRYSPIWETLVQRHNECSSCLIMIIYWPKCATEHVWIFTEFSSVESSNLNLNLNVNLNLYVKQWKHYETCCCSSIPWVVDHFQPLFFLIGSGFSMQFLCEGGWWARCGPGKIMDILDRECSVQVKASLYVIF